MSGAGIRRRRLRGGLAAAAASLAAVGFSACDDVAEPADTQITISQTSAPDSLDPALASQPGSLEAVWLAYTPLLSYRRVDGEQGAELIPGLAGDLPEVSDDGRTYTLTLRKDLAYSDQTEVRAGDFEHAVQRLLTLHSPGARFYEPIAGVREYERADDRGADISGIVTDDQTGTVTIRLNRSDPSFSGALALTYAALVPPTTPFRALTEEPPPGVGPYEITAPDPSGGFELTRSPNFAELDIPDIPTGNIARITVETVPSRRAQAERVLAGKLDFMHDEPPAPIRETLLDSSSERYTQSELASTSYFFFDSRRAPFDDPLVREAVNRGVDRAALAALYADRSGGEMQPGCSLLPPGVPGYDPDLDRAECPYGDPSTPPDLAGARALIERAQATGARVTVWGSDQATAAALTTAYARMLDRIGLDARPKLIGAARYAAAVTDPVSRAQTGYLTEAATVLDPRAYFAALDPATLADPAVEAGVGRLDPKGETDLDEDGWRDLDRRLSSPPQSVAVVVGHEQVPTFFSDRMDPAAAVFHPLFRADYSSWRLKPDQ